MGERKGRQAAHLQSPLSGPGRANQLSTLISRFAPFPNNFEGSRVFISPQIYAKKTGAMDVFKAVETYITKMVSEPSAMKVLLLDTHTVRGHMLPALAAQELTAGWLCRHQ